MYDLKGKVAIVTGGGRGLGWSISLAMAKVGADIAIVCPPFDPSPVHDIGELTALGCRAKVYIADVTKADSVNAMVKNVLHDFEKIDILVNNAGKMTEKLLLEMGEDEWDTIIATDLRSVFLCCQAVIPHMITKRSGSIINISSQLAYKGGVRLTHYSAAKAGVIAFTKSLAQEVAHYSINVNAVAPGPLVTDMTKPFIENEGWLKDKESSVAKGRLGTPDEIAPTVVFLASSAASLYIGQTLLPNGGGVMV